MALPGELFIVFCVSFMKGHLQSQSSISTGFQFVDMDDHKWMYIGFPEQFLYHIISRICLNTTDRKGKEIVI